MQSENAISILIGISVGLMAHVLVGKTTPPRSEKPDAEFRRMFDRLWAGKRCLIAVANLLQERNYGEKSRLDVVIYIVKGCFFGHFWYAFRWGVRWGA